MIWGIFKVMALRLLRDRGALAMAFLLPPAIFTIFAAIFSNATNGDLDLDVAMAIVDDSPLTIELATSFQNAGQFKVFTDETWTIEEVRAQVRDGFADTGIVFTSNLSDLSNAEIVIITEPSKEIAATVLEGQVQKHIADNAPQAIVRRDALAVEALVGGFTPQQQGALEGALEAIKTDDAEEEPTLFRAVSSMDNNNLETADPSIAYYAGATAIMFLLFSLMQGASISLEERQNSVTSRSLLGFSGTAKLVLGKFLFLIVQGTAQALFIFLVAKLLFNLPVFDHLFSVMVVSIVMAASAAGISLMVVGFCSNGTQAHTISTFLVLIFSSIGGSMVPSFMMPTWLQEIGRLTPNSWAIDGVYGVLARGAGLADIYMSCIILALTGIVSMLIAVVTAYRTTG